MKQKDINWTKHAEGKREILKSHGFAISKEFIQKAILHPDKQGKAYKNRMVAQKGFDADHIIRIIYEEYDEEIVIVTFYPARRSEYE